MARVLHILPHPGGGGENLVDLLEAGGGAFEHERVYLTRARTPVRALPSVVTGRSGLRRAVSRADLVHVVGDAAACLTAGLLGRRPSVFGTHGLHLLRRSSGVAGRLVRRSLRTALSNVRITVCSSRPELAEIRAICPAAALDKLRLVENGIPLPEPIDAAERSAMRGRLGIGEDAFVVLYAGQLEDRKHPLVAAEAVAELGAPAVLLVAGGGPLRPRLADFPEERVRVLGFRDDVPALLAASDVFVMPSEREGLSLAVLEAMGRGTAVVVSDGAGNPEAVGDAGVVVPVGDVHALADALRGLEADAERRSRLAAAGRERVRERYTAERWLADMEQVFEDALGTGPVTAPGQAAGAGPV
jgi:glycosyltransferase involved in cell wall biosynthesis